MGAGIWLGTVLHRLRNIAGDRAPRLSDAAAMTDEERQRFSRRLRERDAEVAKWREENEQLRSALQQIADDGKNCADHCRRQARRALEPKP